MMRSFLSGDRSRFRSSKHNLDLDLTYISSKLIAMSIPSDSVIETTYRNSLEDIAKFFRIFHPYPNFLVINLSQKRYDYRKLDNMVLEFGWKDHHGPPLRLLFQACLAVVSWHQSEPLNVIAIHCKAGKGRTGTLISACLIYLGKADSAKEALEIFQRARAPKSKSGGVTMPSQIRYVEYFEQIVVKGFVPHKKVLLLKKVVISGATEIDGGAFRPIFRVYFENEKLIAERKVNQESMLRSKLNVNFNIRMRGDILIQIFHEGMFSDVKLGRANFHTGFIPEDGWLRFGRNDWDDLSKNTAFTQDFTVDFYFEDVSSEKLEIVKRIQETEDEGIWILNFQSMREEVQKNKKLKFVGRKTPVDPNKKNSALEDINEHKVDEETYQRSRMTIIESNSPVLSDGNNSKISIESNSTIRTTLSTRISKGEIPIVIGRSRVTSPATTNTTSSIVSPVGSIVEDADFEVGPVVPRVSGNVNLRMTNHLLEKLVNMEIAHEITEETAKDEEMIEEEKEENPEDKSKADSLTDIKTIT